jgi:hypothetical protein
VHVALQQFYLILYYDIHDKKRDKNIHIQLGQKMMRNVDPRTIYDLPCIYDVYNQKLTNWQYLSGSGYEMKINNRHMVAVPFTKSIFNTIRRKRGGERGKSEETKLKISKANKGKRIGCTPWNKGKKLSYITGKREHTEETKRKMGEVAKRRWAQAQRRNENILTY